MSMLNAKRRIGEVIDSLLSAKGDEIRAEVLYANHQLERKDLAAAQERLDKAVVAAECAITEMLLMEGNHVLARCNKRNIQDLEAISESIKQLNEVVANGLGAARKNI